MESKPMLEEIWRIKNESARKAVHDIHRLGQNARQWAAEHPDPGPVVHGGNQLWRQAAEVAGLG